MKAQVLDFPDEIRARCARVGFTRRGIAGFGIGPDTESRGMVTGLCGFWRLELDSGHLFATAELFHIFGLKPLSGPADIVQMCQRIHPDDLPVVMQVFENAGNTKPGYDCAFRVIRDAEGDRKVRAVGMFQQIVGPSGVIVGMTYELDA